LLGVLAGALTAELIKVLSGMPVVLAPAYMFLSLIFSIATGMIFGIYPAWKAAALNPIEALSTT
jgi:putative ABC transport system permease protein